MDTQKIRLNKYLANLGICSRRKADELIASKRVLVNGQFPNAGDAVCDSDSITIDGKNISVSRPETVILAYNKPVGIVCSTVNQGKEHNNIIDAVNYPTRIFPVGRLDKDSEGLILLTNDGNLSNKLMKASNHYEKEYIVVVDKKIDNIFLKTMQSGVNIELKDGSIYKTRNCITKYINDYSFSIILTEGKNRQIRRMCESLGTNVISLKRVRIANILLNEIPTGEYIQLSIDSIKM